MRTKIKINKNIQLTDEELLRFNKHILLDEIDITGQALLKDKHVVLIGLGGLGSPLAYYLASSGIGQITLVDDDTIDTTNLQRQILFSTDDIGKKKVDIARLKMHKLSPRMNINIISERLVSNSEIDYFCGADLIIDATDNFETRSLINKISLDNRVPLIMGAAIKFSGQIIVFRNDLEGQPCYNCLYENVSDSNACVDSGVFAALTGVVGSIQASECIKVLLDIGERLESRLLTIDLKNNDFKIIKLNKDKQCKVCNVNK